MKKVMRTKTPKNLQMRKMRQMSTETQVKAAMVRRRVKQRKAKQRLRRR